MEIATPKISSASMEASPLKTLPAEVRNDIWARVLVSQQPIRVHAAPKPEVASHRKNVKSTKKFRSAPMTELVGPRDDAELAERFGSEYTTPLVFVGSNNHPIALCYTCKQIQEETLSMAFSENTFIASLSARARTQSLAC